MLDQVNGLPAHVLFVHAVVVLVPLAALLVAASAVSPSVRRRLGVVLPAMAFVTAATIPLTAHAGEWLQARVPDTEAVRRHAGMGDTIIPIGLLLLALAVVVWWRGRRADAALPVTVDGPGAATVAPAGRPGVVGTVVAVVAVVVALGAVVQVVRVGDSGAQASWTGKVSTTPHAVPGE